MPLRDDLLNPIAGDNPSGVSLRYAPVYDKIKEARREEDDAPQGEWAHERKVADWKQVIKLAGESLATKSKDLQLAAWLTEAMLRTEGFAGLLSGLQLLQGLVANFWDTLHPEIEDGEMDMRAAPLDWVGSRLDQAIRSVALTRQGYDWFKYKQSRQVGYETDAADNEVKQAARAQAIADGKVTAEEFDAAFSATPKSFYVECKQALDDCLAAIESLNEVCEAKFGDAVPGFGGLRTSLEEVRNTVNSLLQKKRELEPDEQPSAEAGAEEAPAADAYVTSDSGAPAAPARGRKTVSEEPADLDDAYSRVAMVAKYLRQQDPYSPAPYLMMRGLRWGELRSGGASPSLELLAPPATQVRQELKRLSVESNWAELIEAAERAMAMPCARAWLDLQRYAVKALEEFGYPAVAAAIRSELRALLADVPLLPQWTLADDTPTANPETQAWLKEIIAPPAQPEDGLQAMTSMDDSKSSSEAAAAGELAPPDPFQIAVEAARSGNVQQAIEILSREITHERSGRARFQRKIQLARICMSTGHEAMAHPILNEMSDEIERRKLEEWEPSEVVAEPLALLFRCMNQLDGDAEGKKKLYARICRLDPVQALACSK
jgi:type VI secretion system protein ImpA